MRRSNYAQIKAALNDGVTSVQTGVTTRVAPALGSRALQLALVALIGLFSVTYMIDPAFAADAVKDGCQSEAAAKLYGFLNSGARLMIGLGAVGSILMLALGAGFIMFSGGNEGRAKKGHTIVKNVIIALLILGGGFFIKYIVLNVLAAATPGFSADACAGAGATDEGKNTPGTRAP